MKVHVCQSVRGALWNREFSHFNDDKGAPLRPLEAFHGLCDELAAGREFIPVAECDNFDPKKGCLGHPETLSETLSDLSARNAPAPPAISHPQSSLDPAEVGCS